MHKYNAVLLSMGRPHSAPGCPVVSSSEYKALLHVGARNVKQYPEATEVDGMLLLRIDAALYFANVNPV